VFPTHVSDMLKWYML